MAHRAGFLISTAPIALASPAGSPDAYAGLHGLVTDPSGAVLGGVGVTAIAGTGGKSRDATTGIKGRYLFSVLEPGTYTVTFRMAGFRPLRISDVKLAVDINRTLDVMMDLLPASAAAGSSRWRGDGWRKGEAAGRQKGEAELLLRQLSRLYGPLAPAIEGRVRSAGADQLLEWGERLVTSESLEGVFGAESRKRLGS